MKAGDMNLDIESTIKNILINDLFIGASPNDIGLDDGLRDKLGVDSLGFSELRSQCQYLFDVKIEDTDFVPKNFTSIRTLSNLLNKLRAEKQG